MRTHVVMGMSPKIPKGKSRNPYHAPSVPVPPIRTRTQCSNVEKMRSLDDRRFSVAVALRGCGAQRLPPSSRASPPGKKYALPAARLAYSGTTADCPHRDSMAHTSAAYSERNVMRASLWATRCVRRISPRRRCPAHALRLCTVHVGAHMLAAHRPSKALMRAQRFGAVAVRASSLPLSCG